MRAQEARKSAAAWLPVYPAAMLVVFFCIPFAIMLAVSFFARVEGAFFEPAFDVSSYSRLLTGFFAKVMATSIGLSGAAAILAVSIAFPFTYFLSRLRRKSQTVILVFLLSVLSLSEVIIGFSWSTLLSQTAGIGNLFTAIGLTDSPRAYSPGLIALLLGLTYLGLPYAVLIIYPAVARLDPEIPEAARMLGASPLLSFFNVVLPMMRRTILGALILVFVFTLGAYILPQVLGRPQHWTLSVHITDQAIFQSNLPLAAAMAIVLLMVSIALVGITLLIGDDRQGSAS